MQRIGIYLGRHRAHGGGIGYYALTLVQGLVANSQEMSGTEFVVFADRDYLNNSRLSTGELKLKVLPNFLGRKGGWLLDQLLVPMLCLFNGVSLLHSLSNQGFLLWRGQQLVTVHDLFQAFPPGQSAGFMNKLYQIFFKIQFASKKIRFVTDIQDVRKLLLKSYDLSAEKVDCVSLGLGEEFLSHEAKDVEIGRGYTFIIAAFGKRKNLDKALDAWLALDPAEQSQGLVVQISDDRVFDFVNQKLGALVEQSHVLLSRDLDRDKLKDYFYSAKVILNPTLAEGFGLPVLEGLAAGANVVTGPIDWAMDRAGVFICDPMSVESIRAELSRALGSGVADSGGIEKVSVKTYIELARETNLIYQKTLGEV